MKSSDRSYFSDRGFPVFNLFPSCVTWWWLSPSTSPPNGRHGAAYVFWCWVSFVLDAFLLGGVPHSALGQVGRHLPQGLGGCLQEPRVRVPGEGLAHHGLERLPGRAGEGALTGLVCCMRRGRSWASVLCESAEWPAAACPCPPTVGTGCVWTGLSEGAGSGLSLVLGRDVRLRDWSLLPGLDPTYWAPSVRLSICLG